MNCATRKLFESSSKLIWDCPTPPTGTTRDNIHIQYGRKDILTVYIRRYSNSIHENYSYIISQYSDILKIYIVI